MENYVGNAQVKGKGYGFPQFKRKAYINQNNKGGGGGRGQGRFLQIAHITKIHANLGHCLNMQKVITYVKFGNNQQQRHIEI